MILALQRFAEHRRAGGRNLVGGLIDPPSWVASKRCQLRQGLANSVPRVVSDIQRCGPDRFTEAKRSNPVGRVSATLSPECQQSVSSPVTAPLRRRYRPGGRVPETCSDRQEQGKWQRNDTLVTGLGRIVRGDDTVGR